MVICERLKKIRVDNNLTQEEFADIISVSRSSIALYERGSRLPDVSILELLCIKFNLPLDELKEEYNNQKDIKKRNIKSFILFSLTSLLMVFSIIIGNFITVYNKYGYNIYNDELKVKNSTDICIVKVTEVFAVKQKFRIYNIEIINEIKNKYEKNTFRLYIDKLRINVDREYIIFLKSELTNKYTSTDYYKKEVVNHKQFIEALPDYNEDLPYNKQEGKSGKIINYYIDLINKNK